MSVTGADNRVVAGDEIATWGQLMSWSVPGRPDPVAVLDDRHAPALAAVATHARHGTETLIAGSSRASAAELAHAGFYVAGPDQTWLPTEPRTAAPGRIWILTSGSTGRPKRVPHTLDSLATTRADQPPRVWLCPYSPGTYAWWQVVSLSLRVPGQDLVMVAADELDAWPHIATEHGVNAASGTPTFWRQALFRSADVLAGLPLRQITLGGEPVDQAILDSLAQTAPQARISWIYASSEVGAAITVHDGRAGFPVEWLGVRAEGRPVIDVEGDELVISSPHAGGGFTGRIRTGDRVEMVDGRVLITGRQDSDEINVGGMKVSAGMVRDVLLAHPDVRWARVFARRAPIVGNVVAAEIVADGTLAAEQMDLVRWSHERLPEYAVPRRIRVLEAIPMKETLKSEV